MLRGGQRVLTVSRVQSGALGLSDVALSLPIVVGRAGATTVLESGMDDAERAADVLRTATASVR